MITESNKTPLQVVVQKYEERIGSKFKPTEIFYNKVGINQKRFGLLARGQINMMVVEAKALCEFFDIPLTMLL
jgi:hypothetical protein